MAARRRALAITPARAPTIRVVTAAPVAPRVRAAVVRGARRAASAAGRAAWDEKHTLAAVAAGGLLGLAVKNNWIQQLPTVPAIGRIGTIGVALWAIGKYGRNRVARHAASGVLAVAAYQLGVSGSVTGDD